MKTHTAKITNLLISTVKEQHYSNALVILIKDENI